MSSNLRIDYLKKKCAEYSDTELLRFIFLESTDFIDEAIEVFKQEFEKRNKTIQSLIEEEAYKSGSIESIVYQSKYTGLNEDVRGVTYLTTKGLFFIPERIFRTGTYPYGVGIMYLGAIGVVFDEIMKSFSDKETIIEIKQKNTPISLITRIMDCSFGIKINEIIYAEYSANGLIGIACKNSKKFTISFDKSNLDKIISWLKSHSISNTRKKSMSERLFEKLKRKFQFNQYKSEPLSNKLRELKNAYEDGLITKHDYDEKRKNILDQY